MDSKSLENADEDLAYARMASTGAASAMVYGDVVQREFVEDDSDAFTSLSGVRVRVRGENFDATTSTDEEGQYSMRLPGAGTYQVDVVHPPGLASRFPLPDRFTLSNDQGCWRVEFQLTTNGRIRGVVVDREHGQPIPNLVVHTGERFPQSTTDQSGAFDIGPLSAGTYRLVAETGGEDDRVLAKAVTVSRGRATVVRPLVAGFSPVLASVTFDVTGLAPDDILVIRPLDRIEAVGQRRNVTITVERGQSIDVYWSSAGAARVATFSAGDDGGRIRLSEANWRPAPE